MRHPGVHGRGGGAKVPITLTMGPAIVNPGDWARFAWVHWFASGGAIRFELILNRLLVITVRGQSLESHVTLAGCRATLGDGLLLYIYVH